MHSRANMAALWQPFWVSQRNKSQLTGSNSPSFGFPLFPTETTTQFLRLFLNLKPFQKRNEVQEGEPSFWMLEEWVSTSSVAAGAGDALVYGQSLLGLGGAGGVLSQGNEALVSQAM